MIKTALLTSLQLTQDIVDMMADAETVANARAELAKRCKEAEERIKALKYSLLLSVKAQVMVLGKTGPDAIRETWETLTPEEMP